MPRPPDDALARPDDVDLSAVAGADPDGLVGLVERLIRVANSDAYRRGLMTAVDFPSTDIPTFLALNQLALHGALRPTVLAERLETGRPNVTKIVQRLEALGLVVRLAAPADSRGVLVALTAEGRAIAERVVEIDERVVAGASAAWSADEVEAFRQLLARYVAGAETFDPWVETGPPGSGST
ncbi:MarR family transcriptional regulator [Actinotalea sp. M2MS4P-6]|uniref:MarR family winged helix-turn-helix transcriptional regulator n=1 Tax=Actinotalea sp. M2MS4P-6 TaxID=2983762 RepID=UPI0021E3CC1A|nr:MarR family transcriptional regulator [Actinotalea sp. M2MS4P-6]MCV2394292.1 MarR family transcriptional regulator [Actinotalea sp. M2MS4P-6]